MGLSELFSNNLLVKWLRGDTGRYDLAVSMVGVKLGERLVQLGGRDGGLLAALGAKTGLTGQVVGVEQSDAEATTVQQAAERAGVLADAAVAPGWRTTFGPESFDLAVVPAADPPDLQARTAEAFRLLRLGGRCAVIQRTSSDPKRRGAAQRSAVPRRDAGPQGDAAPQHAADLQRAPSDSTVTLLHQCGFRAARLLAERDGLAFYEAIKK